MGLDRGFQREKTSGALTRRGCEMGCAHLDGYFVLSLFLSPYRFLTFSSLLVDVGGCAGSSHW